MWLHNVIALPITWRCDFSGQVHFHSQNSNLVLSKVPFSVFKTFQNFRYVLIILKRFFWFSEPLASHSFRIKSNITKNYDLTTWRVLCCEKFCLRWVRKFQIKLGGGGNSFHSENVIGEFCIKQLNWKICMKNLTSENFQ